MTFESTADLRNAGFKGFHTVRDLRISRLAAVPETAGVYLIVRPDRSPPEFLDISPAGYFKGRDPSVPLEELRGAWVAGSCTLYIGKAGGTRTQATLRSRLAAYLRHGHGARSAHWGGRAIWQLANGPDLLVAWYTATAEEPRDWERAMIAQFTEQYGRRPIANRTG